MESHAIRSGSKHVKDRIKANVAATSGELQRAGLDKFTY
jgi:hypothetical protein